MNNELNCETDLEPNIVNEQIFEKEITLCKNLHQENGGSCCWGKCKTCGVIPFLYKLHKGQLLEDENEIKAIKNKIFN